jgi:predicted nicotinamide N-methyase
VDPLAVYDVPTTLELEDRDIRRTTVWRLSAAA